LKGGHVIGMLEKSIFEGEEVNLISLYNLIFPWKSGFMVVFRSLENLWNTTFQNTE
jgi:hypothetical protein